VHWTESSKIMTALPNILKNIIANPCNQLPSIWVTSSGFDTNSLFFSENHLGMVSFFSFTKLCKIGAQVLSGYILSSEAPGPLQKRT